MKKRLVFSFVLMLSIFTSSLLSAKNANGNLTVTVTDIKNSNGEIDFNLFNKPDGFPNDETKAIKHLRGKIINGKCSVVFENLSFGEYAICIYHDENNDKKFNEAWYGKPLEGVGVSNNAKGSLFGAPKYKDAKFNVNQSYQTVTISITYL